MTGAFQAACSLQRLVKASFADFAQWKAEHRYAVIGTPGATTLHYRHVSYPSPAVILMGSERQGLLPEHQAACDLMVHIPMRGSCDSLNIAIATVVVLYEVLDQRGQHARK